MMFVRSESESSFFIRNKDSSSNLYKLRTIGKFKDNSKNECLRGNDERE